MSRINKIILILASTFVLVSCTSNNKTTEGGIGKTTVGTSFKETTLGESESKISKQLELTVGVKEVEEEITETTREKKKIESLILLDLYKKKKQSQNNLNYTISEEERGYLNDLYQKNQTEFINSAILDYANILVLTYMDNQHKDDIEAEDILSLYQIENMTKLLVEDNIKNKREQDINSYIDIEGTFGVLELTEGLDNIVAYINYNMVTFYDSILQVLENYYYDLGGNEATIKEIKYKDLEAMIENMLEE